MSDDSKAMSRRFFVNAVGAAVASVALGAAQAQTTDESRNQSGGISDAENHEIDTIIEIEKHVQSDRYIGLHYRQLLPNHDYTQFPVYEKVDYISVCSRDVRGELEQFFDAIEAEGQHINAQGHAFEMGIYLPPSLRNMTVEYNPVVVLPSYDIVRSSVMSNDHAGSLQKALEYLNDGCAMSEYEGEALFARYG